MELTEEKFIEILDSRLDEKLKNLPTKSDYNALEAQFSEFPTRVEFLSLQNDVAEIKTLVQRIDKRTDEDTRAVIKDVEKLKTKYA